MICEGILQYRVRQNLDKVFDQKLVVLDWDTHNTKAGRPDAVFLNNNKQLIVVEFEPVLTASNIEHAPIDQALKGAEEWYWQGNQRDILTRYQYTFEHRYRNKQAPPDLQRILGFKADDQNLWDRTKRCIIVAAAPQVNTGVVEAARNAIKTYLSNTKHKMSFEAWIYEITGSYSDEDINIKGSLPELIYQSSELSAAPAEGPGFPPPHQRRIGVLAPEYRRVKELLPKYMSDELENEAGYDVYCQADFMQVLKLTPWHEYDVDVCFEFSRMDSKNDIKGPHVQLRIAKFRRLGIQVKQHLEQRLPEIAAQLGCKTDDLECRQIGWPFKQYRIWKPNPTSAMTPDDIARALGKFCSVVYPLVNPMIRSALSENQNGG